MPLVLDPRRPPVPSWPGGTSPGQRPWAPDAAATSGHARPPRRPRDGRTPRTTKGRLPSWSQALGRLIARFYLRRPELADTIAIRYRTWRALFGGVFNELAYRFGWSRAPALLSANLELTNRCNLKCSFCPTADGRMKRARGTMDDAVFAAALEGAGRLEFALLFQWGEPLLHPRFGLLARRARDRGIRTLVTTNGTLLDDRRIAELLAADLDRVTVSVDGDAATHEAVRGISLERTRAAIRRLVAARDAAGSPMAVDVSMVVAPQTEAAVAAYRNDHEGVEGRGIDRVQTIPLLVRGERRTRCREPWRGGLVVLQDGRVTVCCVDHDGELAVGDVRRDRLDDLWNGDALRKLRRDHATGNLPPLCAGCAEYPTDAAAPRFSSRAAKAATPSLGHSASLPMPGDAP